MVRAGLIEAPVAGATGMIAANTTRPIATPAKPAVLMAYQAVPQKVQGVSTLRELWESSSSPVNYGPGAVKFTVPTIANGFVFVPGGVSGYAPGLPGATGVNCTATFLVTSTTPACQGMLSVYGRLH